MTWTLYTKTGEPKSFDIKDDAVAQSIVAAMDAGKKTCQVQITNPDGKTSTRYVLAIDNIASIVSYAVPVR